jgi:hypothetical protein
LQIYKRKEVNLVEKEANKEASIEADKEANIKAGKEAGI